MCLSPLIALAARADSESSLTRAAGGQPYRGGLDAGVSLGRVLSLVHGMSLGGGMLVAL